MFRLIIGILALITLVSIVFAQEPAPDNTPDNTPPPTLERATETTDDFPPDYDFSEFKFELPKLPPRLQAAQPVSRTTTNIPIPARPAAPSNVPSARSQTFNIGDLPRTASNTLVPNGGAVDFRNQLVNDVLENLNQNRAPNAQSFLRQNTLALLPTEEKTLPLENVWASTPYPYANSVLSTLVENLNARDADTKRWVQSLLIPALSDETAGLPTGTTDDAWRATRARLLLELGQARAAYKVLQQVDTSALGRNPQLAQVWVQTSLMAGETARGCGFVRQQVLNSNTGFWPRALMVCQALQGEAPALELSLKALKDDIRAQDTALFTLLEGTISGADIVERTGNVTPLQAVLYAAYPDLLALDIIPQLPDMMAQRVRDTKGLPQNQRILAAEQVVNLAPDIATNGTNLIGALTQLYDQLEFDVPTVTTPLEAAKRMVEDDNAPMARGLLWQAAAYGQLASARAQALQALWQAAEEDGLTALPLVLLPRQRSLRPEPALAWFAPDVIRMALLGGDAQTAKDWQAVLKNNQNITALQNGVVETSVLLQTPTAEHFEAWWQSQQGALANQPHTVEQALAVLDHAGTVDIPASAWQGVSSALLTAHATAATPNASSFSWLRQVAAALQEDNNGTALLMALLPFNHTNIETLNATDTVNVLKIMAFLKFETPQQTLVRNVLLGSGT